MLIAFIVFARATWIHGPGFEGDWKKYTHVARDIDYGTASPYTMIVSRGFPLFILYASKILNRDYVSATHAALFCIWVLAFVCVWIGLRIETGICTANSILFLLLFYLYHERFYAISLLSEVLYSALILIAFSLISIWYNKRRVLLIACSGIVIGFANSVRPFALIGIGLPLLGFMGYRYMIRKEKDQLKQLIGFSAGLLTIKAAISLILFLHYGADFPVKSIAYPVTLRILHHDGICRSSNGPNCRKLLEINKQVMMEDGLTAREGRIGNNLGTLKHVARNYSTSEMEDLYYDAAVESIRAYPWIAVRNTFLNMISFGLNYDLLFVQSRRDAASDDFQINPPEWDNITHYTAAIVHATVEKPFWLLLLLVYFPKSIRSRLDLRLLIFISFCAAHVLIPSLSGRYLYRYVWPLFVTSFFPLGIFISKTYWGGWPLILTSFSRSANLAAGLSSKFMTFFASCGLLSRESTLSRTIESLISYGTVLTALIVFYVLLLIGSWIRRRENPPLAALDAAEI